VDGFAKTAYIRESRRILALDTLREQDLAAASHPGVDRAPHVKNSVGLGAYRIDLHPSTDGKDTIDLSTLPYEIPLGTLIPKRIKNLIPSCKNIGVTHISNGCTRLHPVEWNIGESAGYLAAYCLAERQDPADLSQKETKIVEFRSLLLASGIETEWPALKPL
jgi:hypothetical protein